MVNMVSSLIMFEDHVFMVVNGACKYKDQQWMLEQVEELRTRFPDVQIEFLFDSHAQLAV